MRIGIIFYSGRAFPLMDAHLAYFDSAIGFDWKAYLAWFDRHPFASDVVLFGYESIAWQAVILVPALALSLQCRRVYVLVLAKIFALTATCVIALIFPVHGAYEFFGANPSDHANIALFYTNGSTAPIQALRSALLDGKVGADGGLISFPSFHSVLAVLYGWAAWHIPFVRWPSLLLNLLLLLATPIHGSHFLIDVIAGVLVAILAIVIASQCVDSVATNRNREDSTSDTDVDRWIGTIDLGTAGAHSLEHPSENWRPSFEKMK